MKKILMSLAVVVAVGAGVIGATGAFFSDTETSVGNIFTAGAIDLKIDNTSYYNGEFNPGTSWELKDLGEGDLFFNFLDLKPGDWGEDTISIHVDTNEAWACMDAELTATDDNGLNEPEEDDGDTTGGDGEGELQNFINFVWWADDGDNVLEDCELGEQGPIEGCVDEAESIFHQNVTLAEFDNFGVPLADSTGLGVLSQGPLDPGQTYYIGKAWCFGDFTLSPVPQDGLGFVGNEGENGPDVRDSGILCDGSDTDNTSQTDSVVGNITFLADQARNNPDFVCGSGGRICEEEADVMLVIDNSGSVNSTELQTMKDAANAFVTALAPSSTTAHIGVVSFNTTATEVLGLSDDAAAITAAINGIPTSGALTNLEDGIETAQAELAANGRVGVAKFMVIITDGEPTADNGGPGTPAQEAEDAATDAKNAGTEIFAVGVGISVGNAQFLQDDIVSAPSANHYFDAADFDDLQAILEDLVDCPNGLIPNGNDQ